MRERGGRTVAHPVPNTTRKVLEEAVSSAVEEGSVIYSDELPSYDNLQGAYQHEFVKHSRGEYVRDDVSTNSIESVWRYSNEAKKESTTTGTQKRPPLCQ